MLVREYEVLHTSSIPPTILAARSIGNYVATKVLVGLNEERDRRFPNVEGGGRAFAIGTMMYLEGRQVEYIETTPEGWERHLVPLYVRFVQFEHIHFFRETVEFMLDEFVGHDWHLIQETIID